MRQPLNLARSGDFNAATKVIASGKGRELMNAIAVRAQGFLEDERALQITRGEAAERRLRWSRRLALAGALAVALIVIIGCTC